MKESVCDHCSTILTKQKRYHMDKCYCTSCYSLFFKIRQCTSCGNRKRIEKFQTVPICKECLYKNTACAKCGNVCTRIIQITKGGPVCTSCSKKAELKLPCTYCNTSLRPSFNRNLNENGKKAYICDICYNNTLPKCSLCYRRRPSFFYNFKKEAICQYCAIEGKRQCLNCNVEFPAGIGNYCLHCKQIKTFKKRVNTSQSYFGVEFSILFKQFAYWLKKRRGVHFTSIHLSNYIEYFQEIEKLSIKLNRIPIYKEILSNFTVAKTRKYLSVTLFLNEIGFIKVDIPVKEEFSNLDMIERYLEYFQKETLFYRYLIEYHKTLLKKLKKQKTSIRSIRLALSPAVGFLKLCQQSNLTKLNDDALYAYLWQTTGQIASVTGFISFLNNSCSLSLKPPKKVTLSLTTNKKSKKQLQQSIIQLLRRYELTKEQKNLLFKLSISYFHGITTPKYMTLTKGLIQKAKARGGNFKMCNEYFYIPTLIVERFITNLNKIK